MRAVIISLLLTCAACVSSTKYPQEWPQPDLANVGCPNISGTYADVGLAASSPYTNGDHPEGHLSRYFFNDDQREITYTKISQVDEELVRVESFAADDNSLSLQLSLGEDFTCRNGRLWISEQLRIVDDGLSLKGRERIGLALLADGSLVGEFRIRVAGRAWLIPILVREEDHILWETHKSLAD